jgi:hypothetical protein
MDATKRRQGRPTKPGIVIHTADGGRMVVKTKRSNFLLRKLKRPSGFSAALTEAFHRGKVAALNANPLA